MKVTAKEIAKQLGLSQAAVSLALRGRPGVGEATRQRILEAAAQLGYEPPDPPSPAARSEMLQLVIYKRHGKVLADSYFFDQLTEGVATQASQLGYHLSISYFYGSQDPQEQLKSLRSLKSAGIILLAPEMRSADMQVFRTVGVPLVVLDNFFPALEYDCVGIDNRHGAWNAVRYLIQCGHTRLGYLHSNVEIRNFRERRDGYLIGCRMLEDPEAAQDSARRIVPVSPATEQAAADLHAYLDTEPMLPTAFFADNDRIAAGCCRALLESGLRIPQDVSVIGFDDSSLCTLMNPPLTTMGIQKERMGALAVTRLHERLQQNTPESVRLLVQPRIVVRGSVLDRTQ